MLVYGENEVQSGSPPPYELNNANKGYLRHFENSLFLQFMLLNGNMNERRQASKEMTICERKMRWMEKHRNFDWDVVLPEVAKLKKTWKLK